MSELRLVGVGDLLPLADRLFRPMLVDLDKEAEMPTATTPETEIPTADGSYELPVVHTHIPARAVELGFWGGLTGAALLGSVDPPLALLVGAAVVVARHRRS